MVTYPCSKCKQYHTGEECSKQMQKYVPVRAMIKVEASRNHDDVYYQANEADAEIARLEAEVERLKKDNERLQALANLAMQFTGE